MKTNKNFKIVIVILLVLVVILALSGLWLFHGQMTLAKQKVFQSLPIPVAMVGNQTVFMKDYLARLQVAEKISASQAGQNTLDFKQNVWDSLVTERKLAQVSSSFGVSVGGAELNREYQLVESSGAAGQNSLADSLKQYGLDAEFFKQNILKPALLNAKLVVWYNQQQNLNGPAYQTAQTLLGRLSSGDNFQDLAKTYSADPNSGKLGGDAGFIAVGDLLPELSEGVDAMKAGEVKLLASRYGLHIIKLEEKDNNGPGGAPRIHIRQIVLKAGDFAGWFKEETNKIKVKIFINPV